jgi:hypothetical protein
VSEKTSSKEMYDVLVSLFQSDNMSRKMILRTKLRECRMTNSDNVTSYLMRITQICDQLAAIGEVVLDAELVNVALNGFTKTWEPLIIGICAREKLPSGRVSRMIAFKRRLVESQDSTSREEVEEIKT